MIVSEMEHHSNLLPWREAAAEVYSTPRVAAQAMTVGLGPGFSIDTGTLKPDGTPWDLESDKDYRTLRAWREEEKPVLLCGSPPCNAFSKMMVFNRSRLDSKKREEMMRAGRLHLQRSCDLYRDQIGTDYSSSMNSPTDHLPSTSLVWTHSSRSREFTW